MASRRSVKPSESRVGSQPLHSSPQNTAANSGDHRHHAAPSTSASPTEAGALSASSTGRHHTSSSPAINFPSSFSNTNIAVEKRTPQTTRSGVVSFELFSNNNGSGQRNDELQSRGAHANLYRKTRFGSASATQRFVDGPAYVWQMIIEHLFKSPAAHVAHTIQSELRDMGIPAEYYIADLSPIDLGSKATSLALQTLGGGRGGARGADGLATIDTQSLSSLVQIMYPSVRTRQGIMDLLMDTYSKLCRQRQIPSDDPFLVNVLASQATAPMWILPPHALATAASKSYFTSPQASSAVPSPTLAFSKASGNILACSLNELVEQMTSVQLTPHLSITSTSRQLHEKLCMEVFITCQHFTTRHALLAKLLQRFQVPASLGLRTAYSSHGIFIDIPDDRDLPKVPSGLLGANGEGIGPSSTALSAEARLLLAVTRLVQLKVSSVIAMWAHHFPIHFDATMRRVVKDWIDESCMGFSDWCDAASELQCCSESIRCSLSEGSVMDASIPPSLVGFMPLTSFASSSTPPSYLFRSTRRAPAGPQHVSSLTALRARHSAFVSLNPQSVGYLIRTIHFRLLKFATSEELFVASSIGAGGPIGGFGGGGVAVGGGAIGELLGRFESTAMWVLDALLDALELDMIEANHAPNRKKEFVAGERGTREDESTGKAESVLKWRSTITALEKALAISGTLLDMNDFHGCFSVFSAVLHPTFSTVYRNVLQPHISQSVAKKLNELVALFDFSNSTARRGGNASMPTSSGVERYRSALASSAATAHRYPPIPLLHALIDELREIETSQPTLLCDEESVAAEGGLGGGRGGVGTPIAIHWRKMCVIATIYHQIRACQNVLSATESGSGEWSDNQAVKGMGGSLYDGGGEGDSLAERVRSLDSQMTVSARSLEDMVDVSTRAIRSASV